MSTNSSGKKGNLRMNEKVLWVVNYESFEWFIERATYVAASKMESGTRSREQEVNLALRRAWKPPITGPTSRGFHSLTTNPQNKEMNDDLLCSRKRDC
jgi:hypothetical protein